MGLVLGWALGATALTIATAATAGGPALTGFHAFAARGELLEVRKPLFMDGKLRVVNSCYQDSLDGEFRQSTGKAKIVEGSDGAKLKVSFFGPFYGDYWVLDRGEPDVNGQYPWSIVGEPSGRYLWMLTREPQPDARLQALLEQRVKALGYDWSLVRLTRQPGG